MPTNAASTPRTLGLTLLAAAACTPAPSPSSLPTTTASASASATATGSEASSPTRRRIAAGEGHTCVIVSGGEVVCWGRDSIGQRRDESGPRPVPGLRGATSLFAADGVTCAHVDDGIVCWGDTMFGELGMPPRLDYVQVPEPWLPIGSAAIAKGAMGMQGACASEPNGPVHCWGEVASPRDGDFGTRFGPVPEAERTKSDVTGREMTKPRRGAELDGAMPLALGINHTCALMPDRTVRCLGSNAVGQLGRRATPLERNHPAAPVEGVTGVVEVATGLAFTCALTKSGEVWCWGANLNGQLGTAAEDKLAPVIRYVTIPGDPHRVKCVGRNENGECCVSPSPRVEAPVEVALP